MSVSEFIDAKFFSFYHVTNTGGSKVDNGTGSMSKYRPINGKVSVPVKTVPYR